MRRNCGRGVEAGKRDADPVKMQKRVVLVILGGQTLASVNPGTLPLVVGIVIVGIDANPQAVDAISKGGNFEASVAQNFTGIGSTVADQVEKVLKGETLTQKTVYVSTTLVTSANWLLVVSAGLGVLGSLMTLNGFTLLLRVPFIG